MARSPRIALLLMATLALALAVAVSPAASANPSKSRLLGGLEDADVNEEGVQQALSFALSEYNKASNDAFHSRAMRVVRARKQVRPWDRGSGQRGRQGDRDRDRDGGACTTGGRNLRLGGCGIP